MLKSIVVIICALIMQKAEMNPQYVFGWADWFFRFVADEAGNLIYPRWVLDGPVDNPNTHWIGNYPQWGSDMNTIIAPGSPEASQMREVFNDLSD